MPQPIDCHELSWNNLVEWLNGEKPADMRLGTLVLLSRYCRGWDEFFVKEDKATKLSTEGVAELMVRYFPVKVKKVQKENGSKNAKRK